MPEKNITKITHEVYRNGHAGLQDHLQESIKAFYERHGSLPVIVTVSRPVLDEAREALAELELSTMPVQQTGGCLAGEIWLGYEQK